MVLYKVFLSHCLHVLKSVDKNLKCNPSNESYSVAVPSGATSVFFKFFTCGCGCGFCK